jgi:hypothetical protein
VEANVKRIRVLWQDMETLKCLCSCGAQAFMAETAGLRLDSAVNWQNCEELSESQGLPGTL